jgi:hypothetical protein
MGNDICQRKSVESEQLLVSGYLTHKSNESTQHCFEPRITHSNSNHGLWSSPNMLGYVQYPLLNINEVMNCDVEPGA